MVLQATSASQKQLHSTLFIDFKQAIMEQLLALDELVVSVVRTFGTTRGVD
jgi:hypothetical protein